MDNVKITITEEDFFLLSLILDTQIANIERDVANCLASSGNTDTYITINKVLSRMIDLKHAIMLKANFYDQAEEKS